MGLGVIGYYLIGINILGFILFGINTYLYTYTKSGQIDVVLTIVSLAGGSLGIILGILLLDRKAEKGNMMSRVFVICILVIQIVIILFFTGERKEAISFAFIEFFVRNKLLIIYLLFINIVTFIVFAIDKYNAIKHRSRIRIVTLLFMAFIGGSIGGLLAMYIFRHKIRKDYFSVGLPMILIMQIILIFYIMNS